MGNHPQMAELFRLVNYYNLPRKLEQKWQFYHQELFLIDRNSETKFVFTNKKKVVNSLVSRTVVDILLNEIQQASTI